MLKFLEMGGYAVYVWPSYALTALVVGLNIYWARRSLREAQADARRRLTSAKLSAKVSA
jgi:heme exporter protein CcmD